MDSIDAWPLFDTMTSTDTVNSTTNVSLINISPSTEPEMLTARKLIVGIIIIQTIKQYVSVSYNLFADGCFHYKLYYHFSDDVNLLTYQLFLQITIHGINSRWTFNCICTTIG